jgi:hypothetical protein
MSDAEYALLTPSWDGPWKVWCNACECDVSISYVERHLWWYHEDIEDSYKKWYVMKDMKAAKARKPLDTWSSFRFHWDLKKTDDERHAVA